MKRYIKHLNQVNSSREFEKTFVYVEGNYFRAQRNMLDEFGIFAKLLYKDLNNIKQHYKNYFNSNSDISIEESLSMFNDYYNAFVSTVADIKLFKDDNSHIKSKPDDWFKTGRFNILGNARYYKDDLLINKQEYREIADHYYNKIAFYANALFKIEEKCATITKPLWQKAVTPIDKVKGSDHFGLMVKQILFEAKNYDPKEMETYLTKRIGTSTTYINSEKSKFYSDKQGSCVGLVYDIKDSFICANETVACLSEVIKEENKLFKDSGFSNVSRVYDNGENKLFAFATKTALPKSIHLKYSDNCNEVVINEKLAEPVALFYVGSHDRMYVNEEQTIDELNELKKQYDLPVIELQSVNKYIKDNQELNKSGLQLSTI